MTDPTSTACRTTQHCAYHGWCRRCDPAFAETMSRINTAIQRTDADESHWGPLYEAVGKALRPAALPAAAPVPPPADRATPRAAVAEVLRYWVHPTDRGAAADAVLAVLPEQTDRATLLREAALKEAAAAIQDVIDTDRAKFPRRSNDRAALGAARQIVLGLLGNPSRPAAEQPAETQDGDRPRCPHCQMPHDLTPGMALACSSIRASIADAERPAVGEQPDTQTPEGVRCVVGCSSRSFRHDHAPHDWEPQPGLTVHCPGYAPPLTEPAP